MTSKLTTYKLINYIINGFGFITNILKKGLLVKRFTILGLFFFLSLNRLSGAIDPVTVIVTLTPPYTPFLNEYGTIGLDKLQVTLIVNDNRMINYPAKLQMFVERVGSGVVMRTGEYASIPPVFLTGGSTEIFSGADLAPFFRAGNNVFSGFDQAQYQFMSRIPDGQYRIGFQVVDAQRSEVVLSNTTYTQPGWFVLNNVPQLNLPRNNSEERVNDIQNVKLEWFPRHLGSMNSAFPVSYQVELFAIRVPGMEPNQVALSAVPDFTDITNQNKYILSSDKYMLEPGVEYAWRVKAITDQGLTLFVNNGFSEVNSFVYGSLCPEPLNLNSLVYGADKALITWDTDPLHSAYEVRLRAKYAQDPVWHSFRGYDNLVEISKILSPNTTYDYQVKAVCLTTESDFTEIDTFRTISPVNENFACGLDDTALVTNKVPKLLLKTGEYIFDGQFPVKLTAISGSNGIFTGTGRMRIPFLNNLQVSVKFASIRVNELNQVYEGELISIYNPNSKFYIDDITDLWSIGDQVGNVITGLDSAAIHLNYAVNDASGLNVSFNGNTVTVNGAATTITTSTGGTTISDSKGNIYAVDAGGNATQVGVSGGTNNTDYAANAGKYNKLNDEMQIVFSDYESDLWAFDTWRAEYEGKQLITSEYEDINNYKVPWKLIPAGKSGTVKVNTLKGDIDLDKVVFKTPTGTEYFLRDGKLTMIGGKTGDVQEIFALYPQGDSLISIGKLNVATYEMFVRKMMLVPVGEQKVDLEGIAANVNKAWLPYGVEWKVTLDAAFTDISWDENKDGKLEAGESGFFSMYSSEMNKLNAAYQTSRGTSEDILYIFVFGQEAQNSDNKELLGDMPLSSQFGYIFKPTDDEISYKTIAHESGHGFFQLRHTFNEDYGLTEKDNLMDYSSGTYLFKQQWDAMFDQQRMVFAFWQGDEEGKSKIVIQQFDTLGYFCLNTDTTRYYRDGEHIYMSQQIGDSIEFSYMKNYFYASYTDSSGTKRKCYQAYVKTFKPNWYLNGAFENKDISYFFSQNNSTTFKLTLAVDSLINVENIKDTIRANIKDSISIYIHIVPTPIVTFERDYLYDGQYGFDVPELSSQINNYEKITVSGTDYYVPWMSMYQTQSSTIKSIINVPQIYNSLQISYRSSDSLSLSINNKRRYLSTELSKGINTIDIELEGIRSMGTDSCAIIVENENNVTIGKLWIQVEDTNNFNLLNCTLIRVKTDTSVTARNLNINQIKIAVEQRLNNNSYNQAFTKWRVTTDTFTYLSNSLGSIPSAQKLTLSQTDSLFEALINAYKAARTLINGHSYVFVVDREGAYNGLGQMPNMSAQLTGLPLFVAIYYQANNLNDTYAHELGHNRSMKHPFNYSSNSISKYSTSNYMDYRINLIRNMFFRKQIKTLKNNSIE